MRSFQRVAASIAFSALMAAGATCARAEDAPLGVRLVDQMNALYGAHPGVRANHAKGAVFEGMFTPAQGADALSSAVFLKGAPTPLIIRFSNAGGVPDAVWKRTLTVNTGGAAGPVVAGTGADGLLTLPVWSRATTT